MCKVKHIFGLFAHAYDLRVYVLFIQPAGCLPAYVLNNNVLIVLLLNECANRYFTHAARTTKRNHNYRWQNDEQYKPKRQVLGRLPNGNTIRLMWFSMNHQPHNATDNENTNTKTIKNILIFCDLISTCILCIRVAMSINCIC